MKTLITNIQELLQIREASITKVSGAEMAVVPSIKNAFLILEDDFIADYGPMEDCPNINADIFIDATDKVFAFNV
jgi:imidazolonepropionase